MASVLSAVGLGGPAIPDPAAYKNMMVEAANMLEVKQMIQTTLDRINAAINEAETAGLPQKNIETFDALYTETQNLLTANLGSAVTAGKLKDIEARLATVKQEQEAILDAKNVKDITALRNKIEGRVKDVKKNALAPDTLKNDYDKLLADADEAIKSVKDPKYDNNTQNPSSEGFQDSRKAHIREKIYELKKRLAELDAQRDEVGNKVFNWERFYKRIFGIMMRGIALISVTLGVLFGGIVMSNAFADEYFWGIRLFYFIYGAVLFPLSIIYGIYKKPYWVAGIFPIYQMSLLTGPVPVPIVESVAPQAQKAPTSSEVTAMVQANMKSITQRGGAQLTLAQRLFNYKVVKDDIATPEQTASQGLLQKICYAELAALGSVALYYGITSSTALKD